MMDDTLAVPVLLHAIQWSLSILSAHNGADIAGDKERWSCH